MSCIARYVMYIPTVSPNNNINWNYEQDYTSSIFFKHVLFIIFFHLGVFARGQSTSTSKVELWIVLTFRKYTSQRMREKANFMTSRSKSAFQKFSLLKTLLLHTAKENSRVCCDVDSSERWTEFIKWQRESDITRLPLKYGSKATHY